MSTAYYALAAPVTSLGIESTARHARLAVWVSHGLAGTLTVPIDDLPEFLLLFCKFESNNRCPLYTSWGGTKRGLQVMVNVPDLVDYTQVISEYGELCTVGEIKARAGEGSGNTLYVSGKAGRQ